MSGSAGGDSATGGKGCRQETRRHVQALIDPKTLDKRFTSTFSRFHAVGLAVSGGADSVALMQMAACWREDMARAGRAVPYLTVLTVDHGLRPEAAAETRTVAKRARDLGLPAEILTRHGPPPESAVQEAAREARYGLLASWAEKQPGPVAIATAHHLDDQAETVLMRLARGSGVDGLSAMRPESIRNGVALLRPLLDVPKSELIGLLKTLDVAWIEDPSNRDPSYERVRMRIADDMRSALGLTPAALALTAQRMARASDALEWMTSAALRRIMQNQPYLKAGAIVWPKHHGLPAEIAVRCLRRLLRVCGGQSREAQSIELAAVERLAEILDSEGYAGTTLGRCQLSPVPEGVVIHREAGRQPLPEVVLRQAEWRVWDGRFDVRAQGRPDGVTVRAFDRAAAQSLILAYGDDALNSIPAWLRASQPVFWDAEGNCKAPTIIGHVGSGNWANTPNWDCEARFLAEEIAR